MDKLLIKRIQSGDANAFEELVHLYEKPVYNMALRFAGNPQDALDLSQEVFWRVYKTLPDFRGDSSFSTWLYRMVSNLCIDHARKEKKRKEVPLILRFDDGDDDQISDVPDFRYLPETELEKKLLQEALHKAIDQLPPDHRMVILLREIAGLSYEEIAESQQIEPGTVKSRLNRARIKLREILIKSGNIPEDFPSNRTPPKKGG